MNDDYLLQEERLRLIHKQTLELSTHSEKVAKIQAKRDVKVAKVSSIDYNEMRIWRVAIIAACAVLISLFGSCTAMNNNESVQIEEEKTEQTKITGCYEAGGLWDSREGCTE